MTKPHRILNIAVGDDGNEIMYESFIDWAFNSAKVSVRISSAVWHSMHTRFPPDSLSVVQRRSSSTGRIDYAM